MPAEQRIIGGGLLIVGVAVVLILIFLFSQGGMSAREAHDKLMDEIFPAWLEAEEDGDYIGLKRDAEEALAVLDEGGRNGIIKFLQGAPGNKTAQRLLGIIKDEGFEKNAKGLFEFEGDWYRDSSHRALVRLREAVEGVKALREVREIAVSARAAVELARAGSGMAVPLAAAKPVPKDDVSIVDPNPVYVHDVELYRVFGVKGGDVEKALATPDPGAGKARTARLRWNKDIAPSNVGERVASIPERAAALLRVSTDVLRSTRELADDKDAAKKLASYLDTAAGMVGAGLAGEPKTAFTENREKFQDGAAIAAVLKRESEMLGAYRATVREFGASLAKTFGE
jgi:hypothetical protein